MSTLLGILGGTFDPIHSGHLHLARTVMAQARLQRVKLIPCYQSPLRTLPLANARDRVTMIRLALDELGAPNLEVDTREVDQPHISYAVTTLQSLRTEMGSNVSLCFIMAQDAFANFTAWHEWQRIPKLCHLIVTARAMQIPQLPANFPATLISQPELLTTQAAGYVWFANIAPLAIAATTIRTMIKARQDASALLPHAVWEYIQQQGLYRN